MKSLDWRTTGARLAQNGRNLLQTLCPDWRKSRLTQRLTQLAQTGQKTAENRQWHGRCDVRVCCGLLTPFGGTTLAVVRARESVVPFAAASVGMLRLGYAPDGRSAALMRSGREMC